MVAGLVLPDYIAAVIERLSADPDVLDLVTRNVDPAVPYPRIASGFPESDDERYLWKMPDFALLVVPAGGPTGDFETAREFGRFDLRAYGPGKTLQQRRRMADLLYRTAHPVLVPPPYYPAGFHAANTIVQMIYAENRGFPDMEPDTDWPVIVASYVCVHMSQRVAA